MSIFANNHFTITTRYKLILALLLLLILGSIITYRNNHNDAQEPAKATTTPSENSATTKNEDIPSTAGSTAVLAHINRETQTPFVSITPLEVLEDSRCPGNAVCIQMGTVKLSARIT